MADEEPGAVVRVIHVDDNEDLSVVEMVDPRTGDPTEYLIQGELEWVLYNNEFTTGAMYRLVSRAKAATGIEDECGALPIRTTCVREGRLTEDQWRVLIGLVNPRARVLTLLPMPLALAALATFGDEPITRAIFAALGEPLPSAWASSEEGDDEGEEESDEGGEDGGDGGEDGEGGQGEDGDESDEDEEEDDGEGDAEDGEGEDGGDSEGDDTPSKLAHYTLREVSPAIEREFEAFKRFRMAPLDATRKSSCCASVTTTNDRGNAMRFMGWLEVVKNVKVASVVRIFSSTRLHFVVKEFVDHLVNDRGLKWSSAAKYLSSVLAVARFAHESHRRSLAAGASARPLDDAVLDALLGMHAQAKRMVQKRDAFRQDKPVAFLEWSEVQTARVRAEKACMSPDADAAAHRDACLLALVTFQPPDRVGVIRLLQLGVSLLATPAGGFVLNMDSPESHKTATHFGPTKTTLCDAIASRLQRYITAAQLDAQGSAYVFHAKDDPSTPLSPSAWTNYLKKVFKRFAGVSMAPKELRASFITFLKSGNHSEAVARSAAVAMRHDSKMQSSAAYDKGKHDRTVAAAQRAAEQYARRFMAA